MAKLLSASPGEITPPFTRELYPYYTRKHVTRKMVPITGRASASFSSMLKLKRIGNE